MDDKMRKSLWAQLNRLKQENALLKAKLTTNPNVSNNYQCRDSQTRRSDSEGALHGGVSD